MQSLLDTLTCFNAYLIGDKGTDLYDHMSYYNHNILEFNLNFSKRIINANDEVNELVKNILKNLHVPQWQWGRYLGASLTVYDFLRELRDYNKIENEKLNEFIELIDEQSKLFRARILLSGAVAVATLEIALPFLSTLGISALFAPIVGLVYTIGVTLYFIYENISDKKIDLFQQIRANLFLVTIAVINFARYGILITAAAMATPIAAILSVVTAALGVLQEVFALIHMVVQDHMKDPLDETREIDLGVLQTEARHQLDYVNRIHSISINLVSAVVSAGIVAVWCFVPGGIFVTIGALVGLAVLFAAKYLAQRYNTNTMNARLKSTFDEIEFEYKKTQIAQPVDGLSHEITQGLGDDLSSDRSVALVEPLAVKWQRDDSISLPSRDGLFATGVQDKFASNLLDLDCPLDVPSTMALG